MHLFTPEDARTGHGPAEPRFPPLSGDNWVPGARGNFGSRNGGAGGGESQSIPGNEGPGKGAFAVYSPPSSLRCCPAHPIPEGIISPNETNGSKRPPPNFPPALAGPRTAPHGPASLGLSRSSPALRLCFSPSTLCPGRATPEPLPEALGTATGQGRRAQAPGTAISRHCSLLRGYPAGSARLPLAGRWARRRRRWGMKGPLRGYSPGRVGI